jgi:8-amino-7-oxononanoate synthase
VARLAAADRLGAGLRAVEAVDDAADEGPRTGDAPSPARGLPSAAAVEGVTTPVPATPLENLSPGDDRA